MTGSPWLTNLIAWLSGAPGWLAAALFATAFVESLAIAGILVPGVAILFAVAALAGKTGMPLSEALVWAGLGAVAGDTLSFALGRLLQGRLTSVWPLSRYPTLIAKGERFFHRHGGKSVVIGRFVGPVRPVIPLVAGALWMPWRRFLAFNISSAVAWAPVYVVPGFMVGSALDSGLRPPAHFYAVIGISLAGLGVVYFILSRIQLGLGEGSRVYRWFEQRMARYGAGHRFWRLYTNDRPARAGEFPLASLLLAATASGLFLIWGQLAVNGILDEFNQAVLSWFQQLRQPLLDGPAIAFTLLGDPPVLGLCRRAGHPGAGVPGVLRGRRSHPAGDPAYPGPGVTAEIDPRGCPPRPCIPASRLRRLSQRPCRRHHRLHHPAGRVHRRRNPAPGGGGKPMSRCRCPWCRWPSAVCTSGCTGSPMSREASCSDSPSRVWYAPASAATTGCRSRSTA